MSLDIQVTNPISAASQFIKDQDGNNSNISVSTSEVGIGTDIPTARLSIKAVNGYTNETFNITNANTGDSIIAFMQGGNGHGNFAVKRIDGKVAVALNGGGSSWVNVDTNGGNFGVGTSSLQAMLDVNGNARCTMLTVVKGYQTSILNIPQASIAPNPGRLETLFIDPSTGKLYYQ
ncbi:hypothetical protein [uncultured Kordia sp.]|uniref:hypothetical protein n=1 Tax=uncultured Kordia sp. TaxID=507699 RepID=UPI00261741DA|nr:hypothetical protein [uncultured Kordia sp.]